MNRNAVTLKEIATAAGCSTRVVSAVLNPGSSTVRVGEATQQRILETARERGYRPNQLARAVATGKSRVLGLVADVNDVEHKAYMLAGAIEAANACNYMIKVLTTVYNEISSEPIEKCMEWRLAGLLGVTLPGHVNDYLRENTKALQIPLALVDNVKMYDDCISVVSDDRQGIRSAAEHLIEIGHKKIGFLGGVKESIVSSERELEFRQALEESNLAVRDEWIAHSHWEFRTLIEPVVDSILFSPVGRPTAIICAGDGIAMSLIRHARHLGVQVPQDLSVVGFANFYMARFCDPPLTTIAQPFREMGRVAAQRLIALLENNTDYQTVSMHEYLPTRLIKRGSTAAPQ